MDLLSYFRVLRRRWLLIALAVVVGAALGVASTLVESGSSRRANYYKASHTLFLDGSSDSSVTEAFTNPDQVAILATTGDVPDAVAEQLRTSETGQQLAEHIVTLTNSTTNTVELTAVDRSSPQAEQLADTFADELVKGVDARAQARYEKQVNTYNRQLAQLKDQADGFLARLSADPRPPDFDTIAKQYDATQNQYYSVYGLLQALTTAGPSTGRLSSLDQAEAVPISKAEYDSRLSLGVSGQNNIRAETSQDGSGSISVTSSSGTTLNGTVPRGLLGAFLGLLVGIGLALIADRLDHRIRTRAEAEEAFGLPVLADVPQFTRAQEKAHEVVALSAPLSRAAEAYRAVRTSLLFQQQVALAGVDRSPGSGGNGSGNGAHGNSEAPDALFEPEQHGTLVIMVTSPSPREGKTSTSANLAAVFAEAGSRVLIVNCDFRRPGIHRLLHVDDQPRTVRDTDIPRVKVVTNVVADPNANPAQVVAAQRQVIAAARTRFDVVILDTAPMLTANDAIELVNVADLVLLVARCGLTTTDHAQHAMEILTRLEAPLGGVVFAASAHASNEYYYYYQQGESGRRNRRTSRREARAPVTPGPTAAAATFVAETTDERPGVNSGD